MTGGGLTAEDFHTFFTAVHRPSAAHVDGDGPPFGPFPWQENLVKCVLDRALAGKHSPWPGLLDLPTGVGKTAALDVAVFTLAAASTHDVRLPRRVVLVVDRRVVVDQAAERARRIADALDPGAELPGRTDQEQATLGAVREALQSVGGAGAPLHAAVLRGGIPRDDSWVDRPDQPTIILSTVDQVGSRLLFRGYGVTDRMRPVHAGLLGADTLFLLDEVHLSEPFAVTLGAVASHRRRADGSLPREPWQVVTMSATPGQGVEDAFRLGPGDRDPERAPRLVKRLRAAKPARLLDVRGAGPAEEAVPPAAVDAVAELDGAAVGVVVNRVATARSIARRLLRLGNDGEDFDVALLTGRMRPLDRDRVYDRYRDRVEAGRPGRSRTGRRLVVVATQSIEAGADLDFDALVTECAPADSLKQRFGRLDRLGDLAHAGEPAEAVVLAPKATVAAREPDPVYGEALRHTYNWLKQQHGKQPFDAGPESDDLARPPAAALTGREHGPLLLSTHLDMLVQTNPRPHTDQPVAPWLHGFGTPDADVTVVWRADLTEWHLRQQGGQDQGVDADRLAAGGLGDEEDVEAPATQVVAACPPSAPEGLQVPLGAVRAWLRNAADVEMADIEGMPEPEEAREAPAGRPVMRWRGPDEAKVVFASRLAPGDTVVVPATYGGIRLDNWDPRATTRVIDLGDQARLEHRGVATLRLHGDVLSGHGAPPLPAVNTQTDREEFDIAVGAWLQQVVAAPQEGSEDLPAPWLRQVAGVLSKARSQWEVKWAPSSQVTSYPVLSLRMPGRRAMRRQVGDFDGSDLTNSFVSAGRPVPLYDHCEGVGEVAAELATRCGLSEWAGDLGLAGRLHDLGKADPRFQRWLHDGDEIAALGADGLVAKSVHSAQDPVARERARRVSGYPKGARHELATLALVRDVEEIRAMARDWDLVLHLVASHHGYCRPLPPVVPDPKAKDIEAEFKGIPLKYRSDHGLERLDAGIPDRFRRLVRRYGWWGLAWLEAILRLADHHKSQLEREQQGASR